MKIGCSLDAKSTRLIKLAVAIGAQREGAVRASARKAAVLGLPESELYAVVTLAVGTLRFPASVAAYSWIRSALSAE